MIRTFDGSRMPHGWIAFLAALLALSERPSWAAPLKSEEVAIIAMRESAPSRELAEHYAKLRQIRPNRILLLEGRPGGDITRQEWETLYCPAIVRWFDENDLRGRVRCLVTTFDVPLKIGAAEPTDDGRRRADQLKAERETRRQRLPDLMKQINEVLEGAEGPAGTALKLEGTGREIAQQFDAAIRAANERLQKTKAAAPRKQAAEALERIALVIGGRAAIVQSLQSLNVPKEQAADLTRRFDFARGELEGMQSGVNALTLLPERTERDRLLLEFIDRTHGLLGSLIWIEEQQAIVGRGETHASFDSELSLVLWPAHPVLFWMPNLLHWRFQGPDRADLFPTLMVARLEAPTLELAKGLVNTAVEIEAAGLKGKFYIDARGIALDPKQRQPGSYADYDECLRNLAVVMQGEGQDVTLDDNDALFQAGACPDAALYCGWYSLSNYVDAFDWQRGAVAYHIASGEAVTLRDPNSNVWCKRMLEDGVCATLGPTHEPYLGAFPRPDEFFPLLLSGKFTLAECYYRTLPFNSWVMILVGDPLYNPYKKRPALKPETLPKALLPVFGLPAGK